jgi:hypothetical protein
MKNEVVVKKEFFFQFLFPLFSKEERKIFGIATTYMRSNYCAAIKASE